MEITFESLNASLKTHYEYLKQEFIDECNQITSKFSNRYKTNSISDNKHYKEYLKALQHEATYYIYRFDDILEFLETLYLDNIDMNENPDYTDDFMQNMILLFHSYQHDFNNYVNRILQDY